MKSAKLNLVVIAVGLLISSVAWAVDNTWTNTIAGGEWNSSSNWSLLAPPNVGTNAWLTNATSLVVNYNVPMAAASFRTLTTSNATLNINAGGFTPSNLSMFASSTVNVNNGGVVTLSGGATLRDLGSSSLVLNGGVVSNISPSVAIVVGNGDYLVVSNNGTLYSGAAGVQVTGDNSKLIISGGSANLGAFLDTRDNGANGASAIYGLSISNSTVIASSMTFGTVAAANMSVAAGSIVTNTGAFLFSGADNPTQNRSANYVQTGGSVVSVNSNIVLTGTNLTYSRFTVTGGTLQAPGIVLVSNATYTNAFATFAVTNNGTVYLGANGITQNAGGAGSGYTNVFGGNATIGAYANWSSSVNTILTNGTTTIRAGNATGAAYDISLSGILRGPGNLTKDGGGKLMLSGINTYTGQTIINAGTLAVNGSLAVGGGVFVHAGGSLSGTGTVNQAVTVATAGQLSPGNSGGVLTVSSLTLSNNFVFNWGVGLTLTDRVDVTTSGGLNFAGANAILRLEDDGGPAATNNTFVLMNYTGPDPASFPIWTIQPTGRWVVGPDAAVTLDSADHQVLLTGVYIIPEPMSLELLLLGGWLMWTVKRRRKE